MSRCIQSVGTGALPLRPRDLSLFFRQNGCFSSLTEAGINAGPQPFRPLNRSLGLLPSIALSRPIQVCPVSNEVSCGPTESQRMVDCPKFSCLTVRVQSKQLTEVT